MRGLMQDWPLLCHKIIDHAATQHGDREVISRSVEGPIHRTNYREVRSRARVSPKRLDRGRLQARRPRRDARLEHLAAPRGLVRPARHRRRLSHGQSAALPRADRLDHQRRRRPDALRRPDLPADRREAPRPAEVDREDRRADRRRAHAGDDARRGALRGMARGGRATSPGGSSTKTPPPACATPPARPAIRRASSTRTARTCCIAHGVERRPTCSAFRAATVSCRSCRCSTPIAGRSPSPRRWPARRWSCRDRSSTAPRSTSCSTPERVTFTAAVPTVWLMLLQHLEASGSKLPHLKRVVIGGAACPRSVVEVSRSATTCASCTPGA